MRTFVINLERETGRRKLMGEQLTKLGLPFEFITAVDGRALGEAEMGELCDMDVVKSHTDWLPPGMIGAALSHLKTYRKIVDEGIDLAMVIEDDVIVNERLPQILAGSKIDASRS